MTTDDYDLIVVIVGQQGQHGDGPNGEVLQTLCAGSGRRRTCPAFGVILGVSGVGCDSGIPFPQFVFDSNGEAEGQGQRPHSLDRP